MKNLFFALVLCLTVLGFSKAFAENRTESLKITGLSPVSGGWLVSFDSIPPGCNGSGYNGFHAYTSADEDSELLTNLAVAKSAQVTMDVKYDDFGGCTSTLGISGLMIILDVQ